MAKQKDQGMKPPKKEKVERELSDAAAARLKKGWKDRSAGEIQKWEEGRSVEGIFVRLRPGQFGQLLVIDTAEGREVFACPTILASRLDGTVAGTGLYIECLGKRATGSGQEAWDFTILEAPAQTGKELNNNG